MPTMKYTAHYYSEASALTEGMHPAFLVAVTEEETPEDWEMAKKSPMMWRWNFAVAEAIATLDAYIPELQTAISSQTFSGGRQPSKSYTWMCALLGRTIAKDESVDPDELVPLPCLLYISRHDKTGQPIEYANIEKVVAWPEGTALLTPALRQKLATWWSMKQSSDEPGPATPSPAAPPAPVATPPAPAPAPAPALAPSGRAAW